jgi:hypothetical protein
MFTGLPWAVRIIQLIMKFPGLENAKVHYRPYQSKQLEPTASVE